MRTDIIPKGVYCYEGDYYCPYKGCMKLFDDEGVISFPYCLYLKKGSIPNSGWNNNEYERVKKLLNVSEDEIFDLEIFELDLLWDSCKECGINELTDDEILNICKDFNIDENNNII